MKKVFVLRQPVEADGGSQDILAIASNEDAELLGRIRFGSHWKHVPQNDYRIRVIEVYESVEEVLADPKFAKEDGESLLKNFRLRESGIAKLTKEERVALGLEAPDSEDETKEPAPSSTP